MFITVVTDTRALVTTPLVTQPVKDEQPAVLAMQDRIAIGNVPTTVADSLWMACDLLDAVYPADTFRN